MQNKIQCPFAQTQTFVDDDTFRAKQYYRTEEKIFLYSVFFISIVTTVLLIFFPKKTDTGFEAILFLVVGWAVALILLLFLYQRLINTKFINPITKSHIPLCGILRVAYDILFRKSLQLREIDVERKSKYGDIYLSFFGLRPVVITTSATLAEIISKDYLTYAKSDPRDLRMPFFHHWVGNNNIVLANGERWREVRQLIHPTVNHVETFLPIMNQKMIVFCEKIHNEILNNQDFSGVVKIKLSRWLKALSLDVAGEALFGYNFNHLNEHSNPGIDATDYVLNEIFNPVRLSFPFLNALPTVSNSRLKNAIKVLDVLVSEMITHYIEQKSTQNFSGDKNVLSMLIEGAANEALTRDELRNNILALILASHETTQVSLSGVLYYLAKHPQLQENLRRESMTLFSDLEAVFSGINEKNDVKNSPCWKLKTFKNLDHFILESLRLYSPLANQNPRTAMEDVELEGFHIPKGTTVIMNLHAIHMSVQEWEDPTVFDPDRFNKGNRGNKYSFLPFGNGPRICSGREFSLIEQKLAVCYLLRRFEITLPSSNYKVPLKRYSFTGIPADHFALCFKERI